MCCLSVAPVAVKFGPDSDTQFLLAKELVARISFLTLRVFGFHFECWPRPPDQSGELIAIRGGDCRRFLAGYRSSHSRPRMSQSFQGLNPALPA